MKKLFVCALAVGLFTACSQDETISQQSPMQISFEGAFVNNASRVATAADPSTTTATLKAFDVWAYMDQAEGLFLGQNNGEDVTGEKGNFTYVNTAYWNTGHTYYFHALAPMNSGNVTVTPPTTGDALGLSNVKFTNTTNEAGTIEAGTVDLLYSTYSRTIAPGADLKEAANTGTVNLTFSHLLSKVKFSFKNTYTNENIHFEVKNIQMTAPATGDINLNNDNWQEKSTWTPGNERVTLAFGTTGDIKVGDTQECADERLTIPAIASTTQEHKVTFDVLLYNGDVLVNEKNEAGEPIPYQHDIYLNDVAFEIGKAYDLYAELNANNIIDPEDPNYDSDSYPIVFDVQEVKIWDQATDEKMDDWLVTKDEELTLITDATTNKTLKLEGDNILNGNGNTLSMLEGTNDYYDGNQHLIFMQTTGNATIKNLTIDGNNATYTFDGDPEEEGEEVYGIRGIFLTGKGTVTLDNVTIKNVTYTLNDDASAKTLKVINSYLEGWTSYNPGTEGIFEKVTFAKGTYGQFRPHGNATLTECVFNNDVVLDLTKLNAGKVVKLVNCKYGDTVITAENIVSLLGTNLEGYAAGKVAF